MQTRRKVVDIPGLKLIKGPHRGPWGDQQIIVQAPDGMKFAIPYEKVEASPLHVEAMLKDTGIGEDDPEVKEAVRQYCLDEINAIEYDEECWHIDDLEPFAIGFGEGYAAALKKRATDKATNHNAVKLCKIGA